VANNAFLSQIAFTNKKDYMVKNREKHNRQQHRYHFMSSAFYSNLFNENSNHRELSEIAEEDKKRAEVTR